MEGKMTTLEDVRDLLQSTVDSIGETIELQAKLHRLYDNLMENAKAVEVAGLKKPNLFPYIQQLYLQKQTLLTFKFNIECRIEDNKKQKKDENMS